MHPFAKTYAHILCVTKYSSDIAKVANKKDGVELQLSEFKIR